jgi:hypothetical protein
MQMVITMHYEYTSEYSTSAIRLISEAVLEVRDDSSRQRRGLYANAALTASSKTASKFSLFFRRSENIFDFRVFCQSSFMMAA